MRGVFPDGVQIVALAALNEPALVATAIAQAVSATCLIRPLVVL